MKNVTRHFLQISLNKVQRPVPVQMRGIYAAGKITIPSAPL
jgi:hypothetical protein